MSGVEAAIQTSPPEMVPLQMDRQWSRGALLASSGQLPRSWVRDRSTPLVSTVPMLSLQPTCGDVEDSHINGGKPIGCVVFIDASVVDDLWSRCALLGPRSVRIVPCWPLKWLLVLEVKPVTFNSSGLPPRLCHQILLEIIKQKSARARNLLLLLSSIAVHRVRIKL